MCCRIYVEISNNGNVLELNVLKFQIDECHPKEKRRVLESSQSVELDWSKMYFYKS